MLFIHTRIIFIIIVITFFFYAAYNHAAKNHSNSIFIYSHGIADTHKQAYRYARYYPKNDKEKEIFVDYNNPNSLYEYAANKHYLITAPFVTFDYPDATYKFRKSSLAQAVDINRLAYVFKKTLQKYNKDIILFGVSRGASTIINFMGQKKPGDVQALILESPFDTMENVVAHKVRQARLHKVPGIKQLSHAIISGIFLKYHMNGIRPIDLVSHTPKQTPILFICSEQDTLIPISSTINLYQTLKEKGYPYVHVLIVPTGKHAHIINGSSADIYQNVVHAFLKHYHLPHDAKRALAEKTLPENTTK